MRKNRKFSAEFKLQCVKEVLEEYKSHKEVCRKYQLDSHQLRKWIRIQNIHLLPFYYFLTEDIIKAHSKRFQSLPRNPHRILQSTEMIEYIESPEFAVEIGDIVSAGVWYYLDIHCGSGVYSEFDPIWLLTYHIDWYLSALTKAWYLCQVQVLFQIFDKDIPYTPWELYHIAFMEIVPVVVLEHNLQPIIDCVKEHRCFEDFQAGRDSK